MKKLKLPVIKHSLPPPPSLGMDDYLEFVMFNLKNFPRAKTNIRLLKSMVVNVPFKIKD